MVCRLCFCPILRLGRQQQWFVTMADNVLSGGTSGCSQLVHQQQHKLLLLMLGCQYIIFSVHFKCKLLQQKGFEPSAPCGACQASGCLLGVPELVVWCCRWAATSPVLIGTTGQPLRQQVSNYW
jgi:hypothetical protein